jgi:ATP-dependent DNA helicase RecQ
MALQRYFNGGLPEVDELAALAAVLRERRHTRTALRKRTGLGERKLARLLALLEGADAAVTMPDNTIGAPPYAPTPADAARAALHEAERQQTVQRSRTDMMRHFAESRQCRTQGLLAYFGENMPRPCGHCDNCYAGSVDKATSAGPFPLHSTVRHTEWGTGLVLRYEGDRVTVLFDDVGYKTLSVPVVEQQNLLELERT